MSVTAIVQNTVDVSVTAAAPITSAISASVTEEITEFDCSL